MKKLFGISTVVVALIVLTGGGFLFNRLCIFRAELDRLKSEGFPVSVSDLNTPAGDSDQVDGTQTFNRLAQVLPPFETEMFTDDDVLNRPADEEMIARFNEINEAYPTVFPLLDKLAKADVLSRKLEGKPRELVELDRVQQLRSCARILYWKSRILAAEGKPDEAINAGLQIFELCDLFGQEPTMIAQLVRTACRGIAIGATHEVISNHDVTEESRRRLDQVLEQNDSSVEFQGSLISERAFGIECLSELGFIQMGYNGVAYLETLQKEVELSQKQPFESGPRDWENQNFLDGWAAGSLVPALSQSRLAFDRTRSQIRALRIINALLAKPESEGQEITQDYLVEIGVPLEMTIDTMTGEPMKIKRVNDKWVVYSVGSNLKDDGGVPHPDTGDFVVGADEN